MTQKIVVTGTDCFALAAQYLGDAEQFYRILDQNKNLSDPVINGAPQTIIIPDVSTVATDGVPTQ